MEATNPIWSIFAAHNKEEAAPIDDEVAAPVEDVAAVSGDAAEVPLEEEKAIVEPKTPAVLEAEATSMVVKEFVAPEVAVPEEEAAIGGEAFLAVEEEQHTPVEEAATDLAEAPEAPVFGEKGVFGV